MPVLEPYVEKLKDQPYGNRPCDKRKKTKWPAFNGRPSSLSVNQAVNEDYIGPPGKDIKIVLYYRNLEKKKDF